MNISIHAPRGGSDAYRVEEKECVKYFNPRSPWGERLIENCHDIIDKVFQSTLPVGGATAKHHADGTGSRISIHAPRGGSD